MLKLISNYEFYLFSIDIKFLAELFFSLYHKFANVDLK